MRYEAYEYLFPPRPGTKQVVPPSQLGFYEERGWKSQYKKNGTASVIFVSPEREVTFKSRHRDDHKQWVSNDASEAAFKRLPGSGWYVLVGELLNNKVKNGTRNTTYLFDLLVDDGNYLVGSAYAERQDRLFALFDEFEDETYSHYGVDENTWVAKTYESGFRKMYDGITNPEDEGIVLKDMTARLEICSRETTNASWSRKCRKPTKNYPF
jgi:hypothetical protein